MPLAPATSASSGVGTDDLLTSHSTLLGVGLTKLIDRLAIHFVHSPGVVE